MAGTREMNYAPRPDQLTSREDAEAFMKSVNSRNAMDQNGQANAR
jgi:hypothetical protein